MGKRTRRHGLITRIWHWLNLACVVILFMSGLTISNAHRYLYWGEWGFAPEQAWLAVPRFPGWLTIPSNYNLAEARDWHLLMVWPFSVGLLVMWIAMLASGHFWRDIRTRLHEWKPRAIWHDITEHFKLNFDHGGGKFNFLQKLAYGVVLGIFLPGMIFSGLAISPGFEPSAPWLVDLFGGRQSARSVHFLFSWGLFGFALIHVALVVLAGPIGQIRDMITGGSIEGEQP